MRVQTSIDLAWELQIWSFKLLTYCKLGVIRDVVREHDVGVLAVVDPKLHVWVNFEILCSQIKDGSDQLVSWFGVSGQAIIMVKIEDCLTCSG